MKPSTFSRDNPSPAKAEQAISVYKHRVGDPRGLAELVTFFREQETGFCAEPRCRAGRQRR